MLRGRLLVTGGDAGIAENHDDLEVGFRESKPARNLRQCSESIS